MLLAASVMLLRLSLMIVHAYIFRPTYIAMFIGLLTLVSIKIDRVNQVVHATSTVQFINSKMFWDQNPDPRPLCDENQYTIQPDDSAESLSTFRQRLKTRLFPKSFPGYFPDFFN